MRIGIMTPNLSDRDAVGNDAVGMYAALETAGYDVALFTVNPTSTTALPTYNYDDAPFLLSDGDVVIYHLCTADSSARSILRRLKCAIIIRYHNIIPGRYFMRFDPELTGASRLGRDMLRAFADLPVDLFLGDSSFNVKEFLTLGIAPERTAVLPPFHQAADIYGLPEEGATLNHLRNRASNILSVGRFVPNKNHEAMLLGLARYVDISGHRPHLNVVGSHDIRLTSYIDGLHDLGRRLGIADCLSFHHFVGPQALGSYYRHSDIFLTTSLFEGFCVPVVEAMKCGLPVVASSGGALRETCGDAALIADTPAEVADALALLLDSDEARERLVSKGHAEFRQRFDVRIISSRFLEIIDTFVDGLGVRDIATSEIAAVLANADWFGLPDFGPYARDLALTGKLSRPNPESRDGRLDIVDTFLRESPAATAFLASPGMTEYMRNINVPPFAAQLSGPARLVWYFKRWAQETYPLTSRESVADFLRWFSRQAVDKYRLEPLLAASERRIAGMTQADMH
jgi:glycosyltransferase involved in cell wall biosynthesis